MQSLSLVAAFAPLFLIAVLANLAQQQRERGENPLALTLVSYALVTLIHFAILLLGLTLLAAGSGALPAEALEAIQFNNPLQIGLLLSATALVGLAVLLPPVRRIVARFIPIDPAHPVHAVALSLSTLVIVQLLLLLGIGLGTLAASLAEQAELNEGQGVDAGGSTIATLWVQQILTALLAIVGVGWLLRRNGDSTFERLGLTQLSGRQALIAAGIGVGLVPVVLLAGGLASLINFGPDPDVEALTEQLLGALFLSPLGIFTLGAAAALGEEMIFRGALQPRFGLWLTAALFALVHSNYGLSFSTLVVLLLGLVLGWVRKRFNTWSAMIVHGVYNSSLGLLTYISASFIENTPEPSATALASFLDYLYLIARAIA